MQWFLFSCYLLSRGAPSNSPPGISILSPFFHSPAPCGPFPSAGKDNAADRAVGMDSHTERFLRKAKKAPVRICLNIHTQAPIQYRKHNTPCTRIRKGSIMSFAMCGFPLCMEGRSPYAGPAVRLYRRPALHFFMPYKLIIPLIFEWCNRYFSGKKFQ